MLGDQVKDLREQKAWSQSHLADAAGLNIRTIQRIEAGDPCSNETMLSLASALGVDVSRLEAESRMRNGRSKLSAGRAAVAALALLPCAIFITVNLLRSAAGVDGPYEAAAAFGTRVMSFQTFNAISPYVFLGGALLALSICVPAIISVRAKWDVGAIHFSGIRIGTDWRPLALAALALSSAGILLTYVALEQYRSLVP